MNMIVSTTCGRIEGTEEGDLAVFRGIPFAAPPVGQRRWQAPEPPEPWDGIRPAKAFGAACSQEPYPIDLPLEIITEEQSEDCLYLNVWTQSCDDAKRPVMVYIPGGGLGTGAASLPWYAGQHMARHDVVVVTINYRLGPLGFLNLNEVTGGRIPATGNEGFLDQVAALAWVRDNIAGFGGDPANVTIYGESAGSWAISTLLAMPSAQGLFHRAIAQSGVMNSALPLDHAADLGREFIHDVGVAANDTEGLLSLPVDKILAAGMTFVRNISPEGKMAGESRYHRAVIDGTVLPGPVLGRIAAGSARNIDLIAGTTRDEMAVPLPEDATPETLVDALRPYSYGFDFMDLIPVYQKARLARLARVSLTDLASAIATDAFMRIPCIRLLEAQRLHRPVRHYIFAWNTPDGDSAAGAVHGIDIGFCFGTHDVDEDHAAMFGQGPAADALASAVMDAWASFARTGDPSCNALGSWPEYGESRATMIIGERTHVVDAPYEEERKAWERYDNAVLETPPFTIKY